MNVTIENRFKGSTDKSKNGKTDDRSIKVHGKEKSSTGSQGKKKVTIPPGKSLKVSVTAAKNGDKSNSKYFQVRYDKGLKGSISFDAKGKSKPKLTDGSYYIVKIPKSDNPPDGTGWSFELKSSPKTKSNTKNMWARLKELWAALKTIPKIKNKLLAIWAFIISLVEDATNMTVTVGDDEQ